MTTKSLGTHPGAALVTDGATHVMPTVVGSAQARNREIAALTTRESVTWADGVNEVTITAVDEAAHTAEILPSVVVCFDAPSNLVADTWLTHADSLAVDSNAYAVTVGQPRTFYFSGDGITRLDAKVLYGGAALGLFVEAA